MEIVSESFRVFQTVLPKNPLRWPKLDKAALIPEPLPVGILLIHLRPIRHKGIDSGATEANQTVNTGLVHDTIHCAMHPAIQRYTHSRGVLAFAEPDGLVVIQFCSYTWLPYHLAP